MTARFCRTIALRAAIILGVAFRLVGAIAKMQANDDQMEVEVIRGR